MASGGADRVGERRWLPAHERAQTRSDGDERQYGDRDSQHEAGREGTGPERRPRADGWSGRPAYLVPAAADQDGHADPAADGQYEQAEHHEDQVGQDVEALLVAMATGP